MSDGVFMKALVLAEHGDPDALALRVVSTPGPLDTEVLVEVHACSLNHLDVFIMQGLSGLPAKLPLVLGSDIAGVVRHVGGKVSKAWLEKRVLINPQIPGGGVLGLHANGGLSEFVIAASEQLIELPHHIDFITAATLPTAYATAHRMLITRGRLKAEETILIVGASGGVGIACLQIALSVGARPLAVTSSESKAAKLRTLGAIDVLVIDDRDDFSKTVRLAVDKGGVDVAVNYTGGDSWLPTQRCVASQGRILTCGSTAGHNCQIDPRFIWSKETEIIGSTGYNRQNIEVCLAQTAEGIFKPLIDRALPLERAGAGLAALANRSVVGKVVITPQNDASKDYNRPN
jgi:alcohol dehydrogenase